MVAHHTIPGSHNGPRVPEAAARGDARHLSAGVCELQASQEARSRQGVLQPAQSGGERARARAERSLARVPPIVERYERVRPHAPLPKRPDVDT
eukprot:807914-Prymnesium_polylepis.1